MDSPASQKPRRGPRHPRRVPRFLIRDRDAKYGPTFDTVFQSDDLRVLRSAPRAPQINAHREQVISTLRRELFDHILIMDEGHARQVLKICEEHYN